MKPNVHKRTAKEEIRAREPEADEAEKPGYERAGRNEKDGNRSRLFSLLACGAQPGNRIGLMPTLRRHTQSAAKVRYRARSAQACPSLPPCGVTGARLPLTQKFYNIFQFDFLCIQDLYHNQSIK